MEKKEIVIVGAAVALVLYTLVLGALGPVISATQTDRTIPNAASVKTIGVGVYWDQACSNRVTSINWGVVEPGSSVDKTVYIRNEGNAASTLSKATSNWNPANASGYIALNWDYGGQTVNINEAVQVKFTLVVSSSIAGITSFSFDTVITASG